MNKVKSRNIQLEVLRSTKSLKGLSFMSMLVITLHYFAILMGNLHKDSTLYRYILLRTQNTKC